MSHNIFMHAEQLIKQQTCKDYRICSTLFGLMKLERQSKQSLSIRKKIPEKDL